MAQKSVQADSSNTFKDADIDMYLPVLELPKEPKTKLVSRRECKSFPPSNSERLKVITDSITHSNKQIKFAQGYRILVYSGTNKDEANRAKGLLYQLLPNEDNYNVYRQPNFRVLVGNYSDRLEAYRVLKLEISKVFPNAIVIQDNILIKK